MENIYSYKNIDWSLSAKDMNNSNGYIYNQATYFYKDNIQRYRESKTFFDNEEQSHLGNKTDEMTSAIVWWLDNEVPMEAQEELEAAIAHLVKLETSGNAKNNFFKKKKKNN